MTTNDFPRLHGPRLADVLGRRVQDMPLTRMRRRHDDVPPSVDPEQATTTALRDHLDAVQPGQTVAIGVGSRGIKSIAAVVAAAVRALHERGAEPFVVPAMGSHGGSTAEGQAKTLAGLGITEASVGAPVRATMETVALGMADDVDVAFDANALTADHILVINRLKSHTSFTGEIESGLAKMLTIGLGKQHGAEELHRFGPADVERRVTTAARFICAQLPVLGGIALVEGLTKQLVAAELVPAAGIGGSREAELLRLAKTQEARLPVHRIDVLVVDAMGKEYSGTGMDTNVLGRRMVRSMPELESPDVTQIVCLEVDPESNGNAMGIGLADFVPERALAGFDLSTTYANALTAGSQGVQRAQIPIVLRDNVDAVSGAILTSEVTDLSRLRLARIRNTLELDEILVSEPLVAEASGTYEAVPADPVMLFGTAGRLGEW
ncbi:MAG: DUF362 domain-containing protein [Streptosporangiales bacterium]